jgi:hypothetical protein
MIPMMSRDRVWADMYEVARRMTETYDCTVSAVTRREGARRVQGLETLFDGFEPVRERRRFSRAWSETQRVDVAASRSGRYCERPANRAVCAATPSAITRGSSPYGLARSVLAKRTRAG